VNPTKVPKAPLDPVAQERFKKTFELINTHLYSVEERIRAQARAFDPAMEGYVDYVCNSSGKRLRPALALLAGGATGKITSSHVDLAVILELIHIATLVHDDIMDGADLRREQPTAHALKLAAELPSAEVSRLVASSSGRVCAGEILQSHRRRRWAVDRADYFKVIEMKTAELFALSCDLGARLSGGTPREIAALRQYGLSLGTAYQIYDDCLDLYGAESAAGKSLGTDLASGKVTLPLIMGLDHSSTDDRARLIGWLEDWKPEFFPQVRNLLDRHQALDRSRAVIGKILNDSDMALSILKTGPQVDALHALNRFLARQTDLLAGS